LKPEDLVAGRSEVAPATGEPQPSVAAGGPAPSVSEVVTPPKDQPAGQILEPPDSKIEEVKAVERVPVPAKQPQTYTVKLGDSFWSIANKVYGDGKHVSLIAAANPQASSDRLRPGQTLTIPPLPAGSQAPAIDKTKTAAGDLAKGDNVYVVQKGDGFWAIAEKVYGHGKYWPAIRQANPGVREDRLQPGQKLVIPALSSTTKQPPAESAPVSPAGGRLYVVGTKDTASLPLVTPTRTRSARAPANDGKPVFD
jgi:nucleoid-associated protein YgaU